MENMLVFGYAEYANQKYEKYAKKYATKKYITCETKCKSSTKIFICKIICQICRLCKKYAKHVISYSTYAKQYAK
jgi:hypothetical protein